MNEIHQDIKEAYTEFIEKTIPYFCQKLKEIPKAIREDISIIDELHSFGINVRFLYIVRTQLLDHPYWSAALLLEIICRVLKDNLRLLLRNYMKQFCYPGEVLTTISLHYYIINYYFINFQFF